MPSILLWGVPILVAVIALLVVVGLLRRRRGPRSEASSVFPPASTEDRGFQVRLLEDRAVAQDARVAALRGEVQALRREASYAQQRGLDRRAERLQALVTEREEELAKHEAAGGRAVDRPSPGRDDQGR